MTLNGIYLAGEEAQIAKANGTSAPQLIAPGPGAVGQCRLLPPFASAHTALSKGRGFRERRDISCREQAMPGP